MTATADILRRPHLRDLLLEEGEKPLLVIQPLMFLPVRYVHADRTRTVRVVVGRV